MSISQNKKRKARKAKRSAYAKEIARKIRQGILPKCFFATGEGGMLERTPAKNRFTTPGLSMRLISTFAHLTKDHYEEVTPVTEETTAEGETTDVTPST